MTTLIVAAGGGGDAVGALMLSRLLLTPEDPVLIASCAWERLRIDPLPGPRPVSGFTRLLHVADDAYEVTNHTDTIPSGHSQLPRLTAEIPGRIFFVDLYGGAQGVARQLTTLAECLNVQRLAVVDIGGDIVGTGHEPGLRSPLADGLSLAGALHTGIPTSLIVAGVGLDAELNPSDVHTRLGVLKAQKLGTVLPQDVRSIATILDWHPSEASAALAAAALGLRGEVDMRRGDHNVTLTNLSTAVWLTSITDLRFLPLAECLTATVNLQEAEGIVSQYAPSELAYETAKASALSNLPRPTDWTKAAPSYAAEALARGAKYTTTRRLLEAVRSDRQHEPRVLASLRAARYQAWPLWRLSAIADTSLPNARP